MIDDRGTFQRNDWKHSQKFADGVASASRFRELSTFATRTSNCNFSTLMPPRGGADSYDVSRCWWQQTAKKSSEPGNCQLILCDRPTRRNVCLTCRRLGMHREGLQQVRLYPTSNLSLTQSSERERWPLPTALVASSNEAMKKSRLKEALQFLLSYLRGEQQSRCVFL